MGVLSYKDMFPELGEDVLIAPGAWVIGDVTIGDRSSVWFNTIVRGDVHYIRIGSETNIQDNSTLHVTEGRFPLEMGDRITVGHRAVVHGCIVEDDCLIGMGAVIMDGARVGKGSLVAGGAVVPPGLVIPPGSMVMGVPAKVVRPLDEAGQRLVRESAMHYVELAREYIRAGMLDVSRKVKGFLG
jgi:carbonic anhydrase/acetyltransferase-like protein (isoleucine patch superfamily)